MTTTIQSIDRNIIPYSSWTQSTGTIGIFGANGEASENQRVFDTGPFGSSVLVWKSAPLGQTNSDGGWNTDWFTINPSKMYRFTTWMRRTSSTTGGTFYFGMYADGDQSRRTDNNSVNTNLYWECSGLSRYNQNQWYLVVGHVYPHDTSFTGRHPDSGFWTTAGVKTLNLDGCGVGSGDAKWSSNSKKGIHRTYHYYCPDNTSSIQWYAPRVDVCDGSEPSISDLLQNINSSTVVTLPDGSIMDAVDANSTLLSIQSFRTSGTWTKPDNCKKVLVKVTGGGGGAAGYCESGGAGGYSEKVIDVTAVSSVSVTVGGGGSNTGYYAAAGDGGTSSFGSYCSATGGYGANRNYSHTGGIGGVGSGGNINLYGGTGTSHANSAGSGAIGRGGQSYFGGASGTNRANGGSRVGHGSPGTGGPGGRTDGNYAGGVGEGGIVIVMEYS